MQKNPKYKSEGIAAALTIQGHHIGLQQASKDSLSLLNPDILNNLHPLGLRLSEPEVETLIQRMIDDDLNLPNPGSINSSVYEHSEASTAAGMLDVRMLYSALVDADFIETEAHFKANPDGAKFHREAGLPLLADQGLNRLLSFLNKLSNESKSSPIVNQLRNDLLDACLEAATNEPGLYTLTAPTGAGKTLSMLAFSLKHALENNLIRIVTVIPYLSIIEQTAQEYRKVFEPLIGKNDIGRYILEHHSLAGTWRKGADNDPANIELEDEIPHQERLLAENWDAPIVVTTSVQFLESLFSNRPSSCRKLHRLAKSVILLDEVQTLPVKLAIPTLATLSRLAERYGTTVVFSTATQPAFSHLGESIKKYCSFGWRPLEIAPERLDLFGRIKRTRTIWPDDLNTTISWAKLAERIAGPSCAQVLCIVNLKRHALALHTELKNMGVNGLLHLSTNMCPTHRQAILEKVRNCLESKKPCRLISTQCVEAGVDVDFPIVFRALGPLDAIAQAAGRCNRNGLSESGEVHLFIPESETQGRIYPDGAYEQATGVTRILFNKYGSQKLDLNMSELFKEFYHELYNLAKPELRKKELLDAINLRDFREVARLYRVIENNAINILVPYDIDRFHELEDEVRQAGLSRRWIAKARLHAIGLFRPRHEDPVRSYLDPIPLGKGSDNNSDEWFIYLFKEHYSQETGLNPPQSLECLIA